MPFQIDGMSHVGKVRSTNADRFLAASVQRMLEVVAISPEIGKSATIPGGSGGHILVVADGIGSSEFGHEASSLTIETIIDWFTQPVHLGHLDANLEEALVKQLGRIILDSHERVRQQVNDNPERKGMATTVTMAFVLGPRAWIMHVGDSRAYLVRGGVASRLTKDQTVAQMLVDSGVLDADAAENSRLKHILASAIGGSESELPEVLSYRFTLQEGDALVLCTDGLNKHVPDEEIGPLVAGADSAGAACTKLVGTTLERGGTDNVTVVVGRMTA